MKMVHKRSQNKLQERKNKSFSNNKRKRDKVNSLNETIENKDKEITQLKRQKTFAHVVFFVTSKTVVLSLDSRWSDTALNCSSGSCRLNKGIGKKGAGTSRASEWQRGRLLV
ncbi:unnamed protein product [Rhizophagus irregularis]|uniref:Uncharacterized protein n=1 Tax=Rhizophagus irregularis TaxID=588596 RepID=A0A915Z956_9GLOM|nr:unnamed protein product [Rhizophagus irregularis]